MQTKLFQLSLVKGHLQEALYAEMSAVAFQIAHVTLLARLVSLYLAIGVDLLNENAYTRREWYVIVLVLSTFVLCSSHQLGVLHVPLVEE